MNSGKVSARIVGVFFILATAAPILASFFAAFLGGSIAGERSPDYLVRLSANEWQIGIAVLIEFAWVLSVIGIPVVLFPIL